MNSVMKFLLKVNKNLLKTTDCYQQHVISHSHTVVWPVL